MDKTSKISLVTALIMGGSSAIVSVIQKQSPILSLIIFAVFMVAVYFLSIKMIKKIRVTTEPKNHAIFYTIDRYIKIAIKEIPISNIAKKRMTMIYLGCKFANIKEALQITIDDNNIGLLPQRMIDALERTRNDAINHELPTIFIDKITEWEKMFNCVLIELMGNIVTSNYTKTDTEKLIDCLDTALVIIKTSFIGAETTLNQLNGELNAYIEKYMSTIK